MPAVFQRLSGAIRVVMLRRIPVDTLLGMLDDFLGVVYRKPEETDAELLVRGRLAAAAFDDYAWDLYSFTIGSISGRSTP